MNFNNSTTDSLIHHQKKGTSLLHLVTQPNRVFVRDVTSALKTAVGQVPDSEWQPIYRREKDMKVKTGSEWAEVCVVPNELCHSKDAPEYRYIAKHPGQSN